jgi:hypothetical protein
MYPVQTQNRGMGAIDWGALIRSGAEAAGSILRTVRGLPSPVPNVPPPAGGYQTGGYGSATWIALAAGAAILFVVMSRKR